MNKRRPNTQIYYHQQRTGCLFHQGRPTVQCAGTSCPEFVVPGAGGESIVHVRRLCLIRHEKLKKKIGC